MEAKESADAKSKGPQDERDMSYPDSAFLQSLYLKKKITKREAGYTRRKDDIKSSLSCVKCKFNLGDESRCHLVGGRIDNERGISRFFSPKGDGMLPGDIVWLYVKKIGKKIPFKEGHVIKKGAQGFKCKDCKYYLYSGGCLLIRGRFRPEMSCGYIVKVGNGTEI